jgi:hypothetical protein
VFISTKLPIPEAETHPQTITEGGYFTVAEKLSLLSSSFRFLHTLVRLLDLIKSNFHSSNQMILFQKAGGIFSYFFANTGLFMRFFSLIAGLLRVIPPKNAFPLIAI